MRGTSHKQRRRTAQHAQQQQLLWRALVGSLFVCAALVSPARSQQPTQSPDSQREAEASVPRVSGAPFRSLIAKALRLRADGQISPDDTFDFEIEADRADDGTLSNVNFAGEATVNGHWHDLARDLISALSDSRALSVLRDARHLSIRLKSDVRGALASLSFEAPTAERATQLANGYNLLLGVASAHPRGANAAALLSGAQVSASGKQFTARLEMTRERLGNLLSQSLALP